MRISIDGNVGSGKSSVLGRLQNDLNVPTFCEPVRDWYRYLQEYYHDPKRWAFCLNLKVMTSYSPHIRQETTSNDMISVWERHPFACRHVFTQLGIDCGYIDELESRVVDDVMKSMPWMLPDVLIYIKTSPEVCRSRTIKRARECEEELTQEYLEQVHNCYEKMIDTIKSNHKNTNVWIVDGNRDEDSVYNDVKAVVSMILKKEYAFVQNFSISVSMPTGSVK